MLKTAAESREGRGDFGGLSAVTGWGQNGVPQGTPGGRKRQIMLEMIQIHPEPLRRRPGQGSLRDPDRRWRHEAAVGAPWRLLRPGLWAARGRSARGAGTAAGCPDCSRSRVSVTGAVAPTVGGDPRTCLGPGGLTPAGRGRGPGPDGHAGIREADPRAPGPPQYTVPAAATTAGPWR